MDLTLVPEHLRHLFTKNNPRPSTWEGIVGNKAQVEIIREAIEAAKIQYKNLAHTLLFGPPGMGKSTISRQIANDLGGGYVETTGSTFESQIDMIRILNQLNDMYIRTEKPACLFIDEIHMLGISKGRQAIDPESVFTLLEDWCFFHNLGGKDFTTYDGTVATLRNNQYVVYPFTCIGATTEPGFLPQPMLRRFLIQIELEPYTEEDISKIILGYAERMGWTIHEKAAIELAKVSRLNPGAAARIITNARNRAVATQADTITKKVALDVIKRMRLNPLGLTSTDVSLLKALAERHPKGMGAGELCRATGISVSQFTAMQEPFLRQLGFIETLSRRVITTKGLQYLVDIGEIKEVA